ncbi:MAG: UDP-N-acetylglucosamine 1-carboxyvinyltransferase, partial [Novibacillus thermophilus]
MEILKIKGGRPLRGTVHISGAKNSAVALIPATLLADTPTVVENLPDIRDVHIYRELLERLGAKVRQDGSVMEVDTLNLTNVPLVNGNVKQLRA